MSDVARWSDIEREAPELVALARGFLDANGHKTMATLRRDGGPRISGTEVIFADGDFWLGSMPNSVKGADLRRDGRFAVHSASAPPAEWKGDAKLAGTARLVTDPDARQRLLAGAPDPGASDLFVCDITELSVVQLGGDPPDHLVIQSWHPGRGVTRIERR